MNHQNLSSLREAAPLPLTINPLPAVLEQTAQVVFARFSDKLKARLKGRQERALQLALNGHVSHKTARIYAVRSQDGQHHYLVDLARKFCNCPDSRAGQLCKHRLAAYLVEQAQAASAPPSANSLEKVRQLLQARADFLQDAILYAQLCYQGQELRVEIIDLEGEAALVRALPEIRQGVLHPLFPFPGRQSCTRVLAHSLTEITIYR